MPVYRKTAIVAFTSLGVKTDERLPLTREREYGVTVRIGERIYPAQNFRSPRNDEEWRDYVGRLRDCNTNRNVDTGRRGAVFIRTFARDLYQNLAALSPRLDEFLRDHGTARRLVIQTDRPELHALPWGALYDSDGKFLAAGDLSIVECWEDFNSIPETTLARLNLKADLAMDTQKITRKSLEGLPDEIIRDASRDPDIVHIEAHGDAVLNEIGTIGPWTIANRFRTAKIALLWSCYSAAGNSWGESPALCLHKIGSTFVLSFQAELHNLDAESISTSLYRDVFGPKASRDLESAVVRIRQTKFRDEFEFANWASMTVYMRSPLDLSAIPLNGPKVPANGWSSEPLGSDWIEVKKVVDRIKPGEHCAVDAPEKPDLPQELFSGWKGTVIRLDGVQAPIPDGAIRELDLDPGQAPRTHPADMLIWLFDKIASYGAPLIVWRSVPSRINDFLATIGPPPTLTFLLLCSPPSTRSIVELVDDNLLEEARKAVASLNEESGDESWQAAYMALSRGEKMNEALHCINSLKSRTERMLLSGNFVSRFGIVPEETGRVPESSERRLVQEDYYRSAISEATVEKNDRDLGRAQLELGYMLASQGELAAADYLYRAATKNLERAESRDTRWHSALGRVLRDRADLLSKQPERLVEAAALLRRALAIHSFHGRKLQRAYSLTTAARISLGRSRFSEAMQYAIDAANTFEECNVWRGWGDPVLILLDTLSEMGHIEQATAVADLASKKIAESNLPPQTKESSRARFAFKKAQTLWEAGNLDAALLQLKSLTSVPDPSLRVQADRLERFLRLSGPV